KSHEVAFAVLVYQSLWLKRYHQTAFYCAILNNEPMGFWSRAVVAHAAKRHGIRLFPVDANRSQQGCMAKGRTIHIGFKNVHGFREAAIKRIRTARNGKHFVSLLDFCRRTQLPTNLVKNLIYVGAFDWITHEREHLDWELEGLHYEENLLNLVSKNEKVKL